MQPLVHLLQTQPRTLVVVFRCERGKEMCYDSGTTPPKGTKIRSAKSKEAIFIQHPVRQSIQKPDDSLDSSK